MATLTYDEKIAEACDGMIGSMDMGGGLEDALLYYLEREPTTSDLEVANEYMNAEGIQKCSCCGWYQADNEGSSGDMCSSCAEAEAEDMDDGEEFFWAPAIYEPS